MMWIGDESLRSRLGTAAEQLRAAAHGKPMRSGATAARQAHELLALLAQAPTPIWHLVEGTSLEESDANTLRWVHSIHASEASALQTQTRLRARWSGILASHGKTDGRGLTNQQRREVLASMQPADSGVRMGPLGCDWVVRKMPAVQNGVVLA